MPSSQPQERKDSRTQEIPVQNEEKLPEQVSSPASVKPDTHYELHIEAADAPNEVLSKIPPQKTENNSGKFHIPGLHGPVSKKNQTTKTIKNRFWNIFEYLATSALIFTALFFVLNYQAYSALFISKFSQIWGTPSPYSNGSSVSNTGTNDPNHPASSVQQPLPLTPAPDQAKKQVPALNFDVSPPDDRIILPRIQKNVPIVKVSEENLLNRDWGALEKDIQKALQDGVIHYPSTAFPGKHGNVVITGHSSYYLSDPGKFKDVFALLHQLNIGDTVIIYYEQQKYTYQIYEKKVVTPDKVEVLSREGNDRLTLITCTPVGTNLKRLVVLARPI